VNEVAVKKPLFACVLVLSLCSSSLESPVEFDCKRATQSKIADALPKGWRIEEIAKAAHPSAIPTNTHVLAWKRIEDERPLLVEKCLVLCRFPEDNGHDSWFLVSLYRHPRIRSSKDWRRSMVHMMGLNGWPQGAWVFHNHGYEKRPSNKEIYGFMDEFRWRLAADKGFKLLGGAVCKTTWETVVKERPTRDFQK